MEKQQDALNYIAGLEKAIEKKYGKETTAMPLEGWTEEKEHNYQKQRLELNKNLSNKKQLIIDSIKEEQQNTEDNRTCNVCNLFSFEVRDDIYQTKYGCCFKCYVLYVEGREDRWLTGWRPTKDKDKNL